MALWNTWTCKGRRHNRPMCVGDELAVVDVDGSWSEWTSWTECSALCGGGTRTRHRLCDSPAASGTGRECVGHSHQLSDCNTHSCQVTCLSVHFTCSCLNYAIVIGPKCVTWCAKINSVARFRQCSVMFPGNMASRDPWSRGTWCKPRDTMHLRPFLVPGHRAALHNFGALFFNVVLGTSQYFVIIYQSG